MITLDFTRGDTVKVHQKITEGEKTRSQIFEGIVLAIKGRGENKSFIVRKHSYDGVDIERIWQVESPSIGKIEVKSKPKKSARRSKLYYLRKAKHA